MNRKVRRETEFIAASTLKALDVPFLGAEPGARVELLFDDSDGRASEIASQHMNGGVQVNSADLAAAFAFVKDRVFALKRDRFARA